MINIILVTGKHSSEETKNTTKKLANQYIEHGRDATVLSDLSFLLFFKLIFSSADIIDFHSPHSSPLIPLLKIFKRKTTIVFSLHERTEFDPKNNFVRRSLLRFETYVGILNAHQIVTSQKSLQYFIYRRFSILPSYIPQGVDIPAQPLKRKHASRFLVLGEKNICSRTLRAFKTNRQIKLITADKNIFSADTNIDIQKIDAFLILKNLYNPVITRKLAAYGLPIIALGVAEHKEVLKQNAIFINNSSPRRIKEAIVELRNNYQRYSKESTRERKLITNLFNWEHVAKEYLRLYQHSRIIEVKMDSLIKKEALG